MSEELRYVQMSRCSRNKQQ